MSEQMVCLTGFQWEELPFEVESQLDRVAAYNNGLAVAMVARANSGHPAGSLSSMKMYMAAYGAANVTPENWTDWNRDYVVISHGHTSPAAYATLAGCGFFDGLDAVEGFRRCGSPFQGHVEREVPGIDWGSGNLGQGLSAAAGFALAQRARKCYSHVYVLMGDGEQPKGQIAEARRLITAQKLHNVTVLIDVNDIQISGRTDEVLPVHIAALWAADGWRVLECDGHSFRELYGALKEARQTEAPVVILCHTVMGKGVSFMEDKPDYHGKAATGDLYHKAMEELGQSDLMALAAQKSGMPQFHRPVWSAPSIETGSARIYGAGEKADCRSGFGNALADVGELNYGKAGATPILVFDCDLAGSVKTDGFFKKCPDWFIQGGIQEHNTATAAGAASVAGVVSLWADFGVFGLAEAYNQQRLNDINGANIKLALTHVGLDVGEDGMTHQCIDYISLLSSCFNWKLVVPVDANEADRATRWALSTEGNVCLAMGRSKLPVLAQDDKPLLADDFCYGEARKVREGSKGAIIALGAMTHRALAAADVLAQQGIDVAVYAVSSPLAIDEAMLKEAFATGSVVTVEDHNVRCGMGTLWFDRALELGLSARTRKLGVWHYGCSGPSDDVYAQMGLDAASIAQALSELLNH